MDTISKPKETTQETAANTKDKPPDNKTTRKTSSYQTQLKRLENYRICFENITQSDIANALTSYGYDNTAIAAGKTLYDKARTSYESQQSSRKIQQNAIVAANAKQEELWQLFDEHRKLAKVAFRNQAQTLNTLGLKKSFSRTYIQILNACQVFYTALNASETIKNTLKKYQVNDEAVEKAKTLMQELSDARSDHTRKKGIAETATQQKSIDIKEIDKWMRDFEEIAEIALKDQPQLLEALAIYVPS